IDRQLEHGFSFPSRSDDALDLLGRKHRGAVEREGLGFLLLEFDGDVIAGPLRDAIYRVRVGVVHPGIDLETIALARAVLPGSRAQIAQTHLALAAVQV